MSVRCPRAPLIRAQETPSKKGKKKEKKGKKKERKPKEPVVPGALREEPCLPCLQALVKGGDALASVGCRDCLCTPSRRCLPVS